MSVPSAQGRVSRRRDGHAGLLEAGQSETIWWIGLPDIALPPGSAYGSGPAWDTFDALTGEELLRALP